LGSKIHKNVFVGDLGHLFLTVVLFFEIAKPLRLAYFVMEKKKKKKLWIPNKSIFMDLVTHSFLHQIYASRCKFIFLPLSSDVRATTKKTCFSPLNRMLGVGSMTML